MRHVRWDSNPQATTHYRLRSFRPECHWTTRYGQWEFAPTFSLDRGRELMRLDRLCNTVFPTSCFTTPGSDLNTHEGPCTVLALPRSQPVPGWIESRITPCFVWSRTTISTPPSNLFRHPHLWHLYVGHSLTSMLHEAIPTPPGPQPSRPWYLRDVSM